MNLSEQNKTIIKYILIILAVIIVLVYVYKKYYNSGESYAKMEYDRLGE